MDDPTKANPKAINKRNKEFRSDVTKLTQDLEQVKLQLLSSAKMALSVLMQWNCRGHSTRPYSLIVNRYFHSKLPYL